ncbi:uncharacterized protein N7479_009696 [Penicillium vulpinum]|nr:uncharacterized protein N7479_009696 [Penicillium vulpinum]KAJ5951283.1 hypothetical protein N7479_009696 [Penicillium vulpinum]
MDETARSKDVDNVFNGWLKAGLQSGEVITRSTTQIGGGGLGGLNAALDKLNANVSGTKIVVPV